MSCVFRVFELIVDEFGTVSNPFIPDSDLHGTDTPAVGSLLITRNTLG